MAALRSWSKLSHSSDSNLPPLPSPYFIFTVVDAFADYAVLAYRGRTTSQAVNLIKPGPESKSDFLFFMETPTGLCVECFGWKWNPLGNVASEHQTRGQGVSFSSWGRFWRSVFLISDLFAALCQLSET